jgi:toxin-antitoxin system PIN domain toxin
VVLVDTSVWIALSLPPHVFHAPAREWFGRQTATASVLFCRATQQSLLRLLTTESVMRGYAMSAMTNTAAWSFYDALLADRRIAFAPEPPDLDTHWRRFATRDTASSKLWMDAYLAAFAVAGGHQLVTTDVAFKQFQDLDAVVLTG